MNNFKDLIIRNKALLIIVLLSFGVSIFYSFYYQIKPGVDARAYDVIAQNIVNGIGYREDVSVSVAYDYAIGRVGPLYEYFLAVTYKIFGHSYPAVWIFQALLHSISAYLIYLICLLVFAESYNKLKIGLWASAIFGFYPDLIEISAMLMTETLYLFFTCLMIYLFLFYIKNNNFKIFIVLSVVSGLAIMIRPPLLFVLPIIFYYLYTKKEWGRGIIMLFVLILVFLPWTVSNYKIYGEILPFGTVGAYNFWAGNHVGATGEQEPGREIEDFIINNKIIDVQKESITQFKSFVLNYPGEFIKLTFLRINKYFSILRPMGFWFYTSGWKQFLFVLCSAIFSFFVLTLSLGGILRSYKLNNTYVNYLLAFTTFTPLIIFITVVETRYRFQIYPLLSVFAAYYISTPRVDYRVWFKDLLLPLVVVLLNAVIDGFINFNSFVDKIFRYLS